jgi:solute carrier family 13 (sodium-dependent dicarboxylate transporter), member 2/3/5
MSDSLESGPAWVKWTGLAAGPIAAAVVYTALPRTDTAGAVILSAPGAATLAVCTLMAIWWLTETISLEATALIPLALFPVLGIAGFKQAAAPYADEVIYLFMGGMMLGVALERWGLHRRIALWTMLLVGTSPVMLIGGMMLATAVLSMWVSNTATAVMMLPIAASIVALVRERLPESTPERDLRNFSTCLVIGVGYAATIGGVATLIGSPPNMVLAGYIGKTYGDPMTFQRWMWIGIPVTAVFLPASWLLLTRLVFPIRIPPIPGARDFLRRQTADLGPMSRGEWLVMTIFSFTSLAWMFRTQLCDALGLFTEPGGARTYLLSDSGIAIFAALAMFLMPVNPRTRTFVLDWRHAGRMPWGVLLLFGGGLSMSAAFQAHRVDTYVGAMFDGLQGMPVWAIVLAITATIVFATEIGSNTAVTTTFLPIASAAAVRLGVHPYFLCIPVALAASYAFMMPTGTPPNALVFATGHVRVPQMWRAGIVLNILSIAVITAIVYFFGPWLLGFPREAITTPR